MKKIVSGILIILFMATVADCQEQTQRFFSKDEYGVHYWEAKENWTYNWLFKTKANLKSIEIIIIDQEGKQNILVDSKTMNDSFPIEFGFRINDPKLMGDSINPKLSIPFGFSRIGSHPMGMSNWAVLDGSKLTEVVYNKSAFSEDRFTKSGEFILASYKTTDGTREFMTTIIIRYEMK